MKKPEKPRGGAVRGAGVPARKRPAPATRYIESSALVAALLEGDAAAKTSIRAPGLCVTSALTVAESSMVNITAEIIALAGRLFPVETVRTPDAIHLATAAALGEPHELVTVVTRDARVRDNAAAAGHPVE